MPDTINADTINVDHTVNAAQGSFVVVNATMIRLTPIPQPSSPNEGTIYADASDHHVYEYNGTAWKQLDNV